MRNASVTEISKELSVSKSTVSKVLRHCPGVNSDLRAKILQHANEKKSPMTATVIFILSFRTSPVIYGRNYRTPWLPKKIRGTGE